jgi:hypothetical protein
MEGIFGVLVVVLVIALLARVLTRREARRPPETTEQALATPPPTFRVVTLGVSGSGKTVFLASMFHRLSVQRADVRYFLETDAAQRVALNGVFNKARKTDEPWPRGTRTGETREFTFACMSFQEGVKYEVLRLNYLDYAGELLEQEQEAGSTALADLENRINQAHALVGMIDGYRVLQYLKGAPEGQDYIEARIQPMLGMMAAATCPIHLVLSKWDLVRDFGEPEDADDNARLALVRDALFESELIKALAGGHGRGPRVVRLIPVSAVGRKFATLDASGIVVKRPDGEWNPTNIEAPLSAVLPDVFSQVRAAHDQALQTELQDRRRSHMRLSSAGRTAALAKFLSIPTGIALRATLETTLGRPYGEEMASMFNDWVSRPFDDRAGVAKGRIEKAEQQFTALRSAREDVFDQFAATIWRLEAILPASVLSR